MCDMSDSYVWRDYSYVWRDTFLCAQCPNRMCNKTYSYVWHGSFMWVPWVIHVCDMTRACMCHASFICVTWRMRMCDMCDMTLSYAHVSYHSVLSAPWLMQRTMTHATKWHALTSICLTWLMHTYDMTHAIKGHALTHRYTCLNSYV